MAFAVLPLGGVCPNGNSFASHGASQPPFHHKSPGYRPRDGAPGIVVWDIWSDISLVDGRTSVQPKFSADLSDRVWCDRGFLEDAGTESMAESGVKKEVDALLQTYNNLLLESRL